VLQFYRDRGICVDVDGSASVATSARITEIIRDELSKSLFNASCCSGIPDRAAAHRERAREGYDLEYVATGPMLDQEIRGRHRDGRRITALYESGQLVPADRRQLIEKKLAVERRQGLHLQGLSAHAGAVVPSCGRC
jgi:adenylate kinase